jgi:hypothetical protein
MHVRLIAVILIVVLAAVTGAAVASAVQASRVLNATGLHIQGVDGKLYARLESWESDMQADGDGQSSEAHGAHLAFYDEDGNTRLMLGTSARGAHISFFNASGAEQIRLRLDDMGGPSLTLSDDAGLTLFETDPQ